MTLNQNRFCSLLLTLLLTLALTGAATGGSLPFDDPKTYVPALEAALAGRLGAAETWPGALCDTVAALRHYSGVEKGAVDAPAAGDLGEYLNRNEDALRDAYGSSYGWPYELHAAVNALRAYASQQAGDMGDTQPEVTLPGPEDLSHDEAVRLARAAIAALYELTDAQIESIPAYGWFSATSEDWVETDGAYWYIVMGLNDQGFEHYLAFVASPGGEVLRAERNDGNG